VASREQRADKVVRVLGKIEGEELPIMHIILYANGNILNRLGIGSEDVIPNHQATEVMICLAAILGMMDPVR
jgi:hypothetical protein